MHTAPERLFIIKLIRGAHTQPWEIVRLGDRAVNMWFAAGALRDPKVSGVRPSVAAWHFFPINCITAARPWAGPRGFLCALRRMRQLFAFRGERVTRVHTHHETLFSARSQPLFVCAAGEWTTTLVWFTNVALPRPRQLKSVIAARLHAIEPGSGSPAAAATVLSQVRSAPRRPAISRRKDTDRSAATTARRKVAATA